MGSYLFRQLFLPYNLVRQDDGTYVVTNRNHKPLGFAVGSGKFIDYEQHPVRVRIAGLTATKAAKISFNGSEDLAAIWLYNDGCTPDLSDKDWLAYCARLKVLLKLRCELVD